MKHSMKEFFSKIDMTGDCWEWTGAKSGRGYGHMRLKAGGPPVYAHRISYEFFNAPIHKGMCVCHRCDNPSCVNPHHLFEGTRSDNMQDASRKGRLDVDRGGKGTENSNVKLTDDDVREIRRLHSEGWSGARLGRKFGVIKENIYHIVKGRAWRHLL